MLRVLVTPRARRERLGRLADGRIRAFVAAPPGRGKANTRLVRLFARVLRVPEKQVQIVAGTSHVQKLVRVEDIGRRAVSARIPPLQAGHYIRGRSKQRRAAARLRTRPPAELPSAGLAPVEPLPFSAGRRGTGRRGYSGRCSRVRLRGARSVTSTSSSMRTPP